VLQEILDEYLSDLRASMEADEVYARYLEGKEKTITLEEMEKRFGMEG
jgi:ABC-type phosphate transport system auxiliary subunit